MKTPNSLLKIVGSSVLLILVAVIFAAQQSTILAYVEEGSISEQGQHCVLLVEPAASEEAESPTTDLGCFDTDEELELALQNVSNESDNPEQMVTTRLAEFWFGANYSGTIFWYVELGDNDGCRDGDIFNATLPENYRNQVESARSYSGCDELYLYRSRYFIGPSVTCDQGYNTCRNLSYMNNRAKSIRLNP